MKIRNGFISNSSSTSFIVGVPHTVDTEPCPTCGRSNKAGNIDFAWLVDRTNEYDSEVNWHHAQDRIDELKQRLDDPYCEFDKDDERELQLLEERMSKFATVFSVDLSHHGALVHLLRHMVDAGSLVILHEDE